MDIHYHTQNLIWSFSGEILEINRLMTAGFLISSNLLWLGLKSNVKESYLLQEFTIQLLCVLREQQEE